MVWLKNYQIIHNFSPTDFEDFAYLYDEKKAYNIFEFEQNTGVLYLEPTINILWGNAAPLSFKYQMKFVVPLEHPSPNRANIVVSMGVQVELDALLSKKEKQGEQKTTK